MPLDGTNFDEAATTRNLRIGRAYLVVHGLAQNQLRDGDRVCAIGAFSMVIEDQFARDAAVTALQRALDEMRPPFPYFSVGHWNDAPDRTLEEVLALFDKAIAASNLT